MTEEEIQALLASPVGRGMVEAMANCLYDTATVQKAATRAPALRHAAEALAAALRVATDTTCPTCGGHWRSYPRGSRSVCPDCKDGKVQPALVKP